jgi:hypothetical protein
LKEDEFPRGAADLLNEARERTALGEEQPLSAPLRSWLARTLQIDVRRAFASAPEALAAFDDITADGAMYVAAPVALETFLSRYISALLVTPPVAPLQARRPVEVAPPSIVVAPVFQEPAPAPDPSPLETARDLSELLSEPLPEPLLESLEEASASTEQAPLFNPAEPFTVPEPAVKTAPVAPSKRRRWLAAAAVLTTLASVGVAGVKMFVGSAPPEMALLSVQSNPSGVPVFVDGIERGVTPARITLAPGAHILELRRGVPRVIPVTLTAGAEASQYLEFAEVPAAEPSSAPPPPSAAVPAVQEEPAAAPAAPLAGWLTTKAPIVVEIRENGRLLGTSESDRLMLAAGTHQLEFVNEVLGFRASRSVQVVPGKVMTLGLELPRGVVNLNAAPWAEVFIDGQPVGETPIGNLSVPIGPHEIVFRHPQFGERRHAVSVTAGVPVRLSVEMKR